MPITKPFQITTTIVTTIDPSNPEHMSFQVDVTDDGTVEVPSHLKFGVAQAACEYTIEALAEQGIGVIAEVVEEPEPTNARCAEGNMLRYHRDGPCTDQCDVADIVDAEVVA